MGRASTPTRLPRRFLDDGDRPTIRGGEAFTACANRPLLSAIISFASSTGTRHTSPSTRPSRDPGRPAPCPRLGLRALAVAAPRARPHRTGGHLRFLRQPRLRARDAMAGRLLACRSRRRRVTQAWTDSVASYARSREALKRLAHDIADLAAPVPTGTGTQTYLRAILLTADHTAYHVGQIVAVRRALGIWPHDRGRKRARGIHDRHQRRHWIASALLPTGTAGTGSDPGSCSTSSGRRPTTRGRSRCATRSSSTKGTCRPSASTRSSRKGSAVRASTSALERLFARGIDPEDEADAGRSRREPNGRRGTRSSASRRRAMPSFSMRSRTPRSSSPGIRCSTRPRRSTPSSSTRRCTRRRCSTCGISCPASRSRRQPARAPTSLGDDAGSRRA